MSIAGARSNRGDIYQTLIAIEWALTVLSDRDFQWLEIDSITYQVDDVVVGKSDGSLICCQCKKNQTDFRSWSIGDLAEELDKACLELAKNQQSEVRFYSRSDFGALNKLREHSTFFGNEADYLASLTGKNLSTNTDLAGRIAAQASGLSTYEFLCRTSFEITPDFDRIEARLRERLRSMASNSDAAYDAFWTRLDKLGGRMDGRDLSASSQHRLTKKDLKDVLDHAGSILTPYMSIEQVRASFARTSAIGRSWHRDIAGQCIPNRIVDKLLDAIDTRRRAVLLTGLPGSGKTCVMLNLQDALEQRTQTQEGMAPLFIQSREFADLATAQERRAQGLSEQWVEQAARLAEETYVVVVIDSLDVLSIAREHDVLTYFLAQIDQLLLIPNITVVTACRDFDRKYDRRISVRKWDYELQCMPLDWEVEIAPLLDQLGIEATTIDAVTRELIQNPRELALFVELAQRDGSFNVVTSQALAQRYLDTLVRADTALGVEAMKSIEAIADAMLQSRNLSIPQQRFSASQNILRRLCSLNVLQYARDQKLTFGHQTLMDVLVISRALRQNFSLNEFIQSLSPVPFVRPSIRSFVAQLATRERSVFRKQLRAVLTGNAAFHIRRLIAESFAQQVPQDDDWPLIRDLRDQHREIFQVIYIQASSINWHHFWFRHLVPALKETRDAAGLMAHVHRVALWRNQDAAGILAFWMGMLALNWLDGNRIAEQLSFSLSKFETENLPLVAPLLERLLSMPKPERSPLGSTVARCVAAGAMDDRSLWRYIAGEIGEDDLVACHFGNKLRCKPHEFGHKNDSFLAQRMVKSTALLDLAVEAIEQWSQIQSTRYREARIGYRHGYLANTSYNDVHSQIDTRHPYAERILMDAIEAAILDQAQKHSDWWQSNRERLCFNFEGALCYFAVLAFTKSPQPNIDLIGRLLSDKNVLEFELSFELGVLIRTAFIYLVPDIQNAVMGTIQSAWDSSVADEETRPQALRLRAQYISNIPCYLRSVEAQSMLEAYETTYGTLIRKPHVVRQGGRVTAPFSFEVFLNTSDDGVVRLLKYYSGYDRDVDDYFMGGEQEVGWQLREASSRHPLRFMGLLVAHWTNISGGFCDDIMDGIANYLAYRHGELQINAKWVPVEEADAHVLAKQILDELERHSAHWKLDRSAANALQACAHVIRDVQSAERLVFLAIGFGNISEESVSQGGSSDLITTGINMTSGHVAEALMILANNLQEHGVPLPELLPPTLRRFAGNENPAIRALILRRLPYLQSQDLELGWALFRCATQDAVRIWQFAEPCLYHTYRDHFEEVAVSLERILQGGSKEDMETWGRISALSALSTRSDFASLLIELGTLDVTDAWKGAASVWTNTGNIREHPERCFSGIKAGLGAGGPHAIAVAQEVDEIFREKMPPILIPVELIELCFSVYEKNSGDNKPQLFGFHEWLNATSQRDPEAALAVTEIYLAYVDSIQPYFYDDGNQLVQLVTRLFSEAEEREESDDGTMLGRVVAVQDSLLSLGINSIDDWLKAAERQ